MKKIKYLSIYFLFCTIFVFNNSYSQWQNDIRLTNNSASSLTSYNNARCILTSGDTVHVIWSDDRDGNTEIYYKRSIDGGTNWSADKRLTNNTGSSLRPSLAMSGSNIYVVWEDNRNLTGYNTNIFFKYSIDGGENWGADIQLTNKTSRSDFPTICVSGQIINIAWEDDRDGNFEIYSKRSTDGGLNWGTDTRMTNATGSSFLVSVAVAGQNVFLVWADERDGNKEIYFNKSTDIGASWGLDTRLTNQTGDSWFPSISVYNQNIYAVWRDDRDGNPEIYFKRSTDGGTIWDNDLRLTNNTGESFNPSISSSGQNVNIVWRDSRDGNGEIYYKMSTDGGSTWSNDIRLTNAAGDSRFPSVYTYAQSIGVVWTDKRDGNDEIYYKYNPTGNVGIKKINENIPDKFYLYQNYPNPFNPSTTIRFQLKESGIVSLKIFDILGKEVATLLDEKMSAGIYEIEWNISQGEYSTIPSGIYFYRLTSGYYSEIRKMSYLK